MDKIASVHDFTEKLRQPHVLPEILQYLQKINRARNSESEVFSDSSVLSEQTPKTYSLNQLFAHHGSSFTAPLSINLDLTVACNYRCPHCIDKHIINTRGFFDLDELVNLLTVLRLAGLRSIILIGGGEPTIHPKFQEAVRAIKYLGLQCALVSNGSKIQNVVNVAEYFTQGDWIRFSLDAGSDSIFQHLHHPVRPISLQEICRQAAIIKQRNPLIQLGFSFIVMTPEAVADNQELTENYREMEQATLLAKQNSFDYVAFKPYLTRDADGKEVIPHHKSDQSIAVIRTELEKTKQYEDKEFRVLASINLLNLFDPQSLAAANRQPRRCNMQALRQVVTPRGIYACPAYRGNPNSYLGDQHGYSSVQNFVQTQRKTREQVMSFDASKECQNISCIYNTTNWWLDSLERQIIPTDQIETIAVEQEIFL